MIEWLGKLLGVQDLQAVHDWQVRFAAPWAANRPAMLLFGVMLLAAAAAVFYYRFQTLKGRARTAMIVVRSAGLGLLLVLLAEPVISLTLTHKPKPQLVVLVDATDSMNICDKLSSETRKAYKQQLGGDYDPPKPPREDASRMELLRKFLGRDDCRVLRDLDERFRLRCYVMSEAEQVREVPTSKMEAERFDPKFFLEQLKGDGKVTALGEALNDLGRRHSRPAGAVVFSDFSWNHGRPPREAAERFKTPLYAVGVGPREVVDLAAELQTPMLLKKDEKTEIVVHLRQTGLAGRQATVELLARRMGGGAGRDALAQPKRAAEPKTVELSGEKMSVPIPYTPDETGRFSLIAKVQGFEDEVLEENNSAEREVTVRDESLKLLFVEYEPTWEWRFVKEVFHRDPLVGREGFRTFLRSADFRVRQTNELFLETLIRPRSEFFSYDVIFISDAPGEMLSEQFQEMLKEYVSKFGGGVVYIAGPRFGPASLKDTKLADMLPVVIDPAAHVRDMEYELQLTPAARQYEFMMLGDSPEENAMAWANLGSLPWYQPVARPHPIGTTVLAQHATDKCSDEKTPQPLIAVRRYGKGQVVYFGFNETWRLRKKYGEKYYRQLWGQMIYRLGLGRALGSQKRFVVETDRKSYQAGDKVRLRVEAYNAEYDPLDVKKLDARLVAEAGGGKTAQPVEMTVPLSRDKVIFETTFQTFTPGGHRLLVKDPIGGEEVEATFQVAPVTAERRSAVRDGALQTELAAATGGKAYELTELGKLAAEVKAPEAVEKSEQHFELWNTWLALLLVLGLMLSEWFVRKLQNLR